MRTSSKSLNGRLAGKVAVITGGATGMMAIARMIDCFAPQ